MRELLVRPLGLVTRPNIYGQYPLGGFSTAQNLVMRAPGIIEPAPATVLGTTFGAANDVVHQLFSLPSTVMFSWARTGGGVWTIYGNATASVYNPAASVPTFSTTGRITPIQLRDRLIANSRNLGHYVSDPLEQTPPATFRRAGFGQPILQTNSPNTTNGIAIPLNAVAGYSVIIKRTYDDGYVLVSRPSPIVVFLCHIGISPGTCNPIFSVFFTPASSRLGVQLGDVFELYRTNIIRSAVVNTDPGTTLNKIASVTVTAAVLAAGFVSFEDTTVPGVLDITEGEALYTNPGQEGALAANRFPEIAQCVATFKGFAFYANITQRPQLIFKIKGGLSATANPGWNTAAFRAYGIGDRTVTGTVTLGSPTVTAVPATDMVGVAIGQVALAQPNPWPNGTTVQSFNTGAGTITMTANAVAGAASVLLRDVLEVNGVSSASTAGMQFYSDLLVFLGFNAACEVTTSETVIPFVSADGTQKLITFIAEPKRIDTATPLTVRATNGQNYDPPLTSFPAAATTIPYKTYKNLLTWSKDSQPEHMPAPNQAFVGTGEIIAMESTRDALWIFCTDGLFRLSGAGGQWRLDTVDTTVVLAAPRASCVLREVVYCYTNQGFGRVTDAGFEPLSERVVGDLLPGAEYTETASIILERNEIEQEIVIRLSASQVFIYSTRENSYTTMNTLDVTAMAYVRYPVSGSAALAFGRSPAGSAPRYELWNDTANRLTGIGRLQSVFAQDPFTAKQWVDATYIFDAASPGALTPAWNGIDEAAITLAGSTRYVNECRGTAGVPRRAAVGNTIAPGFTIGGDTRPSRFYALSLRYRQFGEQNLKK